MQQEGDDYEYQGSRMVKDVCDFHLACLAQTPDSGQIARDPVVLRVGLNIQPARPLCQFHNPLNLIHDRP